MSQNITNPQDDAERIRLKRLAKLQGAASNPSGAVPAVAGPSAPPPEPKPQIVRQVQKRPTETPAPAPTVPKKRITQAVQRLDLPSWEHDAIMQTLKVTLNRKIAEQSDYDIVWLKHLALELESEGLGIPESIRFNRDTLDRLLIARLQLDPQSMSEDFEYLPFLVSMPAQQTTFEFLVGCWKRLNSVRSALLKKNYQRIDVQQAMSLLDKARDLVISYAGFTLQEPDMFPQPRGRELGAPELVAPLLSLSTLSAPLLGTSTPSSTTLTPTEVEPFLQDLARRFEPDDEIDAVLSPVVRQLLFHETLWRPEALAGVEASWRGVISGLEALVSIKSIAAMVTRMDEWLAPSATAATFERVTLMGPLCRLGVFGREWPSILHTYFSEPDKRTRADVETTYASLRGTLKSLQSSLFRIFDLIVRASPQSREAVLQFFARAISLNVKRSGSHVDPFTVSSDSFMANLQTVMLRFAEPFMDAKYTKIDRIDPLYHAHCKRIDLKEETRIKATSDEVEEWIQQNELTSATQPNFISEIFYLSLALTHRGYMQTIARYDDLGKHVDDMQRHLDMLQGDGSWMGSPFQARTEAAMNAVKAEMSKIHAQQLAYRAQLLDPELVFRSIGFTIFVSTWLIRQADPEKKHPNPTVSLPLPKEVPMAFRTLPEYILEDLVEYLLFVMRHSPESFDLTGKNELVVFALTFLTSTWYIKNPFLKAKINEVLFIGVLPYDRDRHDVLGKVLNEHPLALKNLMSALMHFYIEVEQTGASSQFYDKFNARRNIAYILKAIWNNPVHRMALRSETKNVDKFVRFANLMINDVTYLMDESLSELTQIHNIQVEMRDRTAWEAQSEQHRREREGTLHQLERHASGYTTLGLSTVELLTDFTAETKEPFMMPEIVDRLGAMLDYNLDALVGPKCQDLAVKDPEKYKFYPRKLLSSILQIFLNLSDEHEFIRAVAGDTRSYRRELFEKAAGIARRKTLKSETELEKLAEFVEAVEKAKLALEEEEDLGEIPDEFLDPLTYALMRDPVILPTSRKVIDRASIKLHLLSDSKDPFNRMPLTIEEVIPKPELKAQIEAFVLERRSKRSRENKMDVE